MSIYFPPVDSTEEVVAYNKHDPDWRRTRSNGYMNSRIFVPSGDTVGNFVTTRLNTVGNTDIFVYLAKKDQYIEFANWYTSMGLKKYLAFAKHGLTNNSGLNAPDLSLIIFTRGATRYKRVTVERSCK